jgi:hypothetical protein
MIGAKISGRGLGCLQISSPFAKSQTDTLPIKVFGAGWRDF